MPQNIPPATQTSDSIWDEEHHSSAMSQKSIMAEAQRCVDNADTVGMGTLLMDMNGVKFKEDYTRQIMHMVLRQDAADIANAHFSVEDIQAWSDSNTQHMIRECPTLFLQWAAPATHAVRSIASCYTEDNDAQKQCILEGRGLSLPERCLHTFLKEDAALWEELPVAWIGEKGSELRAAASALGWTPASLPRMVKGRWAPWVEHWTDVLDYPYSFCLANDAMRTLRLNDSQSTTGRISSKSLLPMTGKSQFMKPTKIEFSPKANPVDVALSEIIFEKAFMARDYVLHKHPDAIDVGIVKRQELAQMVDVHLSLGCLNLLVAALANDRMPGMLQEQTFTLPNLDTQNDDNCFAQGRYLE